MRRIALGQAAVVRLPEAGHARADVVRGADLAGDRQGPVGADVVGAQPQRARQGAQARAARDTSPDEAKGDTRFGVPSTSWSLSTTRFSQAARHTSD